MLRCDAIPLIFSHNSTRLVDTSTSLSGEHEMQHAKLTAVFIGLILLSLADNSNAQSCDCPAGTPRISANIPGPIEVPLFPCNMIDVIWQTFVGMNWPADITSDQRGVPMIPVDGISTLKDYPDNPRVWQTWKQSWELFGDAPTPWPSFEVRAPPCSRVITEEGDLITPYSKEWVNKFTGRSLLDHLNQVQLNNNFNSHAWESYRQGIQRSDWETAATLLTSPPPLPVRTAGPLIIDQMTGDISSSLDEGSRNYFRYEIRFSEDIYSCIFSNFTQPDKGRRKCYINNNIPHMPNGSVSAKISWRELSGDRAKAEEEKATYYTNRILAIEYRRIDDVVEKVCQEKTMILAGMHIAIKDDRIGTSQKSRNKNNWAWATFLQRDVIPPCTEETDACSPDEFNRGFCHQAPVVPPYMVPHKLKPTHPCNITPWPSGGTNPIACANSKYTKALSGSIWENYQMLSFVWNEAEQPMEIHYVTNPTLETYVQKTTCEECHKAQAELGDFIWSLALYRMGMMQNFVYTSEHE